ncbi:MAG: hypothetical protein GX220_05540 [Treponema sp.]|nr:hypothetical protein [Treponema sp.]
MSIFSFFTDIFNSLFRSSGPEVKNKQALKKIEAELKNFQPPIYKNGNLLNTVGESFFLLYNHTKTIDNILSSTIFGEDQQTSSKYSDLLVSTGFSLELREVLKNLSYDKRKIHAENAKSKHWQEEQRLKLDSLLKAMQSKEFKQIENIINGLEQLKDVCNYNYLSAIHQFDRSYSPESSYAPKFEPIPIDCLEDVFIDLYYLTANLQITSSTARAIIVLQEQRNFKPLTEEENDSIMTSLKRISGIFRRVLTPENIYKFISLIKRDTEFKTSVANYDRKPIKKYAERLKNQFNADEQRIQTELKDKIISFELKNLFNERPLLEVSGYNNDLDTLLQRNDANPLLWVLPMQILKSFLIYFVPDSIITLLNSIVVEGFFNNTAYKTSFSQAVFACTEAKNKITDFESMFAKGGEFDVALIKSYIAEGRQNTDLLKKLSHILFQANTKAHDILELLVNALAELSNNLNLLIFDSKKSTPEYVSNIKMLFMSSRNRDVVDTLEKNFFQWKNFLEIMKNYVIINVSEK